MDAMQRFNRISAVICLLLSCAPRAYAQDNRHGETMGAAVAKTKLAGVYQHGHSGLQDQIKPVCIDAQTCGRVAELKRAFKIVGVKVGVN